MEMMLELVMGVVNMQVDKVAEKVADMVMDMEVDKMANVVMDRSGHKGYLPGDWAVMRFCDILGLVV